MEQQFKGITKGGGRTGITPWFL